LALMFTVAVIATMVVEQRKIPREAAMNRPAIQIELAPAPDPTPPAPRVADPPAPQPPTPRPVRKKEPVRQEIAPPSPPLMAETAEAVNDGVPPSEDAASEASAPPDRVAAGTIEAQYASTLRTNIDARTVVPDSIEYRLRRPKGETRINFTLDRQGSVLAASIARTSGWDILDRQALGIVKTGRYPPFPTGAFPGQTHHAFLVTLEFHL
jgi:periplasmic protein TonB